jgi:hypothetical protein
MGVSRCSTHAPKFLLAVLAIDRLPASASLLLTIWAGRPHYPFDDGSVGA